jgi:hypothetical protein
MRYFCTYFDSNYLPRALALYHSLRRQCPHFTLWALCMDQGAHQALAAMALPGIELIALEEFERGDEELCAAKGNRSRVEYYFTCTPSLALYVLRANPEVELITYLDADLFFFADPEPLFQELGDASVGIIAHRFPPAMRDGERFGVYNVGYLSFRRDAQGLACLGWWRERCNEWCYDRVEEGRFADQKYLDDWPERFPGTVVLAHPGANVAPWNITGGKLDITGSHITVDGAPLIFYHFHGLRQAGPWLYDPNLDEYGVQASHTLIERVYMPYIRELQQVRPAGSLERNRTKRHWMPDILRRVGRLALMVRGLLGRRYMVVRDGSLVYAGRVLPPEREQL